MVETPSKRDLYHGLRGLSHVFKAGVIWERIPDQDNITIKKGLQIFEHQVDFYMSLKDVYKE